MENTQITIIKSDGYMRIVADGHHKNPIVCAGISAVMQTCELGLKAIADSYGDIKIVEEEMER